MISIVKSASLLGIEGKMVDVEVNISRGLPGFDIVGLVGTSIKESWLRVKSAIENSDINMPTRKITVNLSPANLKKEGSHFDLAIALGIALSNGDTSYSSKLVEEESKKMLAETAFFGELSLNGRVASIRGALPLAICAKECGIKRIVVPKDNLGEVGLIKDVEIVPALSLEQVIDEFSKGFINKRDITLFQPKKEEMKEEVDFRDVLGQEEAKRALLICAAGGHGILMQGSPGCGKTMLASRLHTILPPMSYKESLEATKLYSVAGLLNEEMPFVYKRPFRNPHHSITQAALLGGGNIPKPGEFSLAHYGVLFLDELCEFNRNLLDSLRQPLEEDKVVIARNKGAVSFPGRVMLVAATNPCKCGFLGDSLRQCTCTQTEIARYKKKLSGPFMDRIDIHIDVPRMDRKEKKISASSSEMRSLVSRARDMQKIRFKGGKTIFNSQIPARDIGKICIMDEEANFIIEKAVDTMGLSMRTYHKTLRVARTIADIEESKVIQGVHMGEALRYRPKEEIK